MAPQYSIDPVKGIVRVDYEGSAGFLEWHETFQAILADEDYEPGLHFLGDRRGCEPPSTEAVRLMVSYLLRNASRFEGARWAVVGDQPAELGMTRMTQILSHGAPLTVEFFWNVDEAVAWLLAARDGEAG